jgi:hypothetical protein
VAEGEKRSVLDQVLSGLLVSVLAVVVVAVLFAFAIPRFGHPGRSGNETAAVATLRNLVSAQALFQAAAHVDGDGDGVGEFGTFQELSAAIPLRTGADGSAEGGAVVAPAMLSKAFQSVAPGFAVTRSGYHFRVYLPGAGGVAVNEVPGRAVTDGLFIDAESAETAWCAYAWPREYEQSSRRTFFVNQEGVILATKDPRYSGAQSGPLPGAAFAWGGLGSIAGELVPTGSPAQDGNVWKEVN